MTMKKYITLIIASLIFASCTKEIDIDLNSTDTQLVIEGNITDDPGPYTVKLSKTVNFSDANNYPPFTDAMVIISDNTGIVDTLTETIPGLYQTNFITGIQGNAYTLKIIAENKQYNATSTMPHKVNLDSIYFNKFKTPNSSSPIYTTVPVYHDPVQPGNNYRFFLTVNDKSDKSYLIRNDNIGNGSTNLAVAGGFVRLFR
ncbi:hypothetical protein MASR2M117_09600 [Paludibacter sp.]